MATTLTPMPGEEFVTKLLSGERDFRRIKVERGYVVSAHEGIEELRRYLENCGTDLWENPVNLIGADLSHVVAQGLYLPFLKADGAVFRKSDFSGNNFLEAVFREADFSKASLSVVKFELANLSSANLYFIFTPPLAATGC